MNELKIITEEDILKAENSPTLGPTYDSSHRIAENALKHFSNEFLTEFLKETSKKFEEKLYDSLMYSLWDDIELGLQNKMWLMVDDIVACILANKKWAIEKYVLNERYDLKAIREELVKLIPEELQNMRLKELEEELKKAKQTIVNLRKTW